MPSRALFGWKFCTKSVRVPFALPSRKVLHETCLSTLRAEYFSLCATASSGCFYRILGFRQDLLDTAMMKRLDVLFLMVAVALPMRAEDCNTEIERVIDTCQLEAAKDYIKAAQYSDPNGNSITFSGPSNPQTSARTEDKEKRQRVIECVSSAFESNKVCLDALNGHPRYAAIVRACKDGQIRFSCDPTYQYRLSDGTCSNQANPGWGSWLSRQERLFEPSYTGVAGFRRSVTGGALPSAREVSLKFSHVNKMTRTNREVCLLFVMFGQFVAHDIIDTPVTSIDGRNFQCCGLPRIHQHSQCATIEIPTWDPFYSRFNQTCMQFVRSAPCDTCSQGKRQHINQVTSFVDASVVYGSWEDMTRTVREHQRGRLKTEFSDLGGSLLPQNKSDASCPVQNGEFPFLAGDRRVNQHLILMSLHTLFMREHNRVVGIIEKKYPYYDDLTLFQEARKVVIGELQSIVYNEFLPVLLGEELMTKYGLRAIYDGTSHYDPLVNPTIFTEFSTAGFRLHSLVNRFAGDRPIDGNVWRFKDTYGNVGPLYHGALEDLILTVTGRPGSINGPMVVEDLTEFMYKPSCMEKGLDIVSGNVQRGRDHGLPPYYQVLQKFTGKTITDFNDLQEFIQPEALEQIMEIYSDVKDVDLWIGLLGEFTDSNTFLGLTCRTLIAEQFRRLRYGDRWFFTEPGQFSEEQQKALSNASFGRILCDNLDITMAPNSFYLGDYEYCSNIPSVSI